MATSSATHAGQSVPFLDLSLGLRPLRQAILDDVAELLDTGAFTNGPAVAGFEEAFARYCGVDHAVGVGSGLDALRLGLTATGIEPGAEVIVPAATFVATLEAVTQAGGVPVVADIRDDDYCLDPDAAAAAIGTRTHALMPVHLYGQTGGPAGADPCRRARPASPSSRMPARRTAPSGTATTPARQARSQPSASTRARTSAPRETPERS